jgi:hypothetical protein
MHIFPMLFVPVLVQSTCSLIARSQYLLFLFSTFLLCFLLQLAISQRTLQGLQKGNYESMKDIQVACILHLLAGRDLLGAAKTGSGKTLAFLVPALEKLYCLGWNSLDGEIHYELTCRVGRD